MFQSPKVRDSNSREGDLDGIIRQERKNEEGIKCKPLPLTAALVSTSSLQPRTQEPAPEKGRMAC